MATVGSVEREALLIIKILEHIPRNSWISTQDLQQSLNESGFPLETRRIQRLLKSIAGCPELGVECRDKGKPYGYRRSLPDSNLSQKNLRPQESLLVRLAEEYLKNQIPAPVMKPLQSLFELARESLKESGSTARQKAWLQKVAFERTLFGSSDLCFRFPGRNPAVQKDGVVHDGLQAPLAVRRLNELLCAVKGCFLKNELGFRAFEFHDEEDLTAVAVVDVTSVDVVLERKVFRAFGREVEHLCRLHAVQSQMSDIVVAVKFADQIQALILLDQP